VKKFADFGSERERETGERSGLWAVKTKKRVAEGKVDNGFVFFCLFSSLFFYYFSVVLCLFFFVFNYYYY
jgi:hypothetical protein